MLPEAVLQFWFVEAGPTRWFAKDATFDATITNRFSTVHETALAGGLSDWRDSPRGRLAEILVLDQFSRNMFRGTASAFSGDARALQCAEDAVHTGDDLKLKSSDERYFLYMPYMHSESKEVHEEALRLFTVLGDESGVRYEKLHKEIIDRFGRYPHRNTALGRESTPDELEFLNTNQGF